MALPAAAKVALNTPAGRRLLKLAAIAAAAAVALPIFLIVAVIAPVHNQQAQQCSDLGGAGDPVGAEVGALGGIAGTGITRAEFKIVRGARKPHVTPGSYISTAYGPPWTGINGSGVATAAGLRLNRGAPKKYFVAVDPDVVALGSWVYIWPNPFKWKGAFLAADTGDQSSSLFMSGRRIDFYDWRGRASQLGWGRTPVRVSAKPIVEGDGEDDQAPTTPTLVNVSDPAAPADCDAGSLEVGGSGAGRKAVQIAVQHLGKSAYRQPFKDYQPPKVNYFWCAWFVSNSWRLAGVKIGTLPFTGSIYNWAAASHPELLIKRVGGKAKTLKPPVGSALLYGSTSGGAGPNSPATSTHVNMVRSVNPDGTVMIIGGNQGASSLVTSYGPCRLTQSGGVVRSSCDPRPIYGIVAPSLDSDDSTPTERKQL